MVLYAFDIELSRAALASSESLIPRMRLQWWRDVVGAARAGAASPAHEVAGPFSEMISEGLMDGEKTTADPLVLSLIDAREEELAGRFDAKGFADWADARFGALSALAAAILTDGDAAAQALARRAGPVLGTAFALRHATKMAAHGGALLPEISAADRSALASGALSNGARTTVKRLVTEALATLATMRTERKTIDRRATPAFLSIGRAERTLRRASVVSEELSRDAKVESPDGLRTPAGLSGSGPWAFDDLRRLDAVNRPFDGLRLAWAAATGRW